MRIALINSVYDYGSTGRIVKDLAFEASSKGHEYRVFYGRAPNTDNESAIKFSSDIDTLAHGVLTRCFDLHGFGSSSSTRHLLKHLLDFNPDIVHLHNLHGYYLNVEILFDFLKASNVAVVWTLHDCWPFTGHCAYYTDVDCIKWQTECYGCPQTGTYPRSSFFDFSTRNYWRKKNAFGGHKQLTLVVPSRWLAAEVARSYLKEYSVEVIHNGIDIDVFQPRAWELSSSVDVTANQEFCVLAVASSWEERKGLADIVKLSKFLAQDERLVVVGLNPSQAGSMPSDIVCVPRISDPAALAGLYSKAGVFVNTTRGDNYPTTNLEAIACGTPVVSYDSGGSGEMLGDGCGSVVKIGDLGAMYEKITEIRKDNLQGMLSAACRNRAISCFDKVRASAAYVELYEEIVSR